MKKFTRNCPRCGQILSYSSKYTLKTAITKNKLCASCGAKLKNRDMSGENNPMYGRNVQDIWNKKFGKEIAEEKYKQWKYNVNAYWTEEKKNRTC